MILVINTPALHLGFLGCYGNEWVATPNLDRLAAEAVVFDQHFVDRPLFQAGEFHLKLPGVEWIDMPTLLPPWNLREDLLGVYGEDDDGSTPPWPDPPIGLFAKDSWTDLERLQNTYAAAVTNWDARLGDIINPLRDSGQLDAMSVCVTASSGMPLGEHGQIGPFRPWLHEEVAHVPLILRLPGGREAGMRIAAITQTDDLLPSFRDMLIGDDRDSRQKRGLMPLIRGEADHLREYAFSSWRIGPAQEWSLRTRDWSFLLPMSSFEGEDPRGPQLYARPEDRWEINNVCQQNQEFAEKLAIVVKTIAEQIATGAAPESFPPLPSQQSESVL